MSKTGGVMMNNLYMKYLIMTICISLGLIATQTVTYSTVLQGGIGENNIKKQFCTVIDKHTRKPVPNAKISIPTKNFTAYSDINGHFELKPEINGQTILSIEKNNYKPFSITLTREANSHPFVAEIEVITPFDIMVDSTLCHLGDNNFSTASANAEQFKSVAVGPIYSKSFFIQKNNSPQDHYLVIGSIVGIDTALARGMGQNKITTSFASQPSVYLNGQKIAEIQINGDNQKIRLPHNLIKYNNKNIITIKAGRNLMQTAYIDYDDIEFMNIFIKTESANYQTSQHVSYR
jgi:hypothetical protein